MKRKLIKQRDSLTVTLPKKWVQQLNLQGGEEIELNLKQGQIMISAEGIKEKTETSISITKENENFLKSILAHVYRKGYDKVNVAFYSPKILPKIEQVVKDALLGFGVVEKTENNCVIENIAEPSAEKYDVLLRRIFLIIKETASVILQDCEAGKFENLSKVTEQSNNLDKYVFFCRRVISKNLFTEKQPIIQYHLLVFLINIERSYFALYHYLSEQKKIKISKETIDFLKDSINFYDLFYDAYFKKDLGIINEMNQAKNDLLYKKSYQLLETIKGPEAVIIYHSREVIRLTLTGISSVLTMLL